MEKRFRPSSLPKDSCLWSYLDSQAITEVPASYSLSCGLAILGFLCRRAIWIDQVNWRVWPNLSVLLVGPSGIGKDVAIDAGRHAMEEIKGFNRDTIIGGATSEAWKDQLLQLQNTYGSPTVALLPANEFTALLGGKDYQKSMVQELTDLLSTGSAVDISTKSAGKQVLYGPTLTVLAGSTPDWLQKAMPEGSLEGGLLPRFLIVVEHYTDRFVPLVKYHVSMKERKIAAYGKERFIEAIVNHSNRFKKFPEEITIMPDAADEYTNWYYNRFKLFAVSVQPYANRSRDQVLRIAMLCAISRGHNWIDAEDMEFGIDLITFVGQRIEGVLKPPSKDKQVADELLELVEAAGGKIVTTKLILGLLARRSRRDIEEGLNVLVATGQLKRSPDGKLWTLPKD